jgi:three-Cys-motif partner protein
MTRDINKAPYDEPTLTKLDIFEQYLIAWLPVFIHSQYTPQAVICDFIAGSGQDSVGVPGSPLRILNAIEKFRDQIDTKDITIRIHLNDSDPDKAAELQSIVAERFDPNSWDSKVSITCHDDEFKVLFDQEYEQLRQQPNLLFIDQYGVKEVTDDIFQKLIALDKTDFLFFISSSSMKRFAATPQFRGHFPNLDPEIIKSAKYENVHRVMLEYYKEQIPPDNATRLYPYTLKKNANIYGLVFGSKHPLGVEKFLDLAWDQNQLNGEANFDIDDDVEKTRETLFDNLPDNVRQRTKRQVFESRLEVFINECGEVTNREVYLFTLNQGHPKSHARECVRRLKAEGVVSHAGQIGFSYDSCIKGRPTLKTIKATNHG